MPNPIRILVVGRLDAVGELYAALDADERFVAHLCTSVGTVPCYVHRTEIDCVLLHHAAVDRDMQSLAALTTESSPPTLVLGTQESPNSTLGAFLGNCARYLGDKMEPAAVVAAILTWLS